MASNQDDLVLELVGQWTIRLAPIWIPGAMFWYYKSYPEKVNAVLGKHAGLFKTLLYSVEILAVLTVIVLVARFILMRKKEKERYLYYQILPHVENRNSKAAIETMVEQLAGYKRPDRIRWFRGREWFQWLIHHGKDGISFYIGFPSDRKTGVIRTLQNMYPAAEFHPAKDLQFPKASAYGGKMVFSFKGLDSGLPLASYEGGDGIGDMVSYMEPGTWLEISFSPDSPYKLVKKLKKAQKSMKNAEKKISDMDSFERQRFDSIKGRLSGRDKVFRVSLSISSEHQRAGGIVHSMATSLGSIMNGENGLEFKKNKNSIKPCPYPLTNIMDWTGKELANLLHLPDTRHKVYENIPHLQIGQRALAADELNEGITIGYMKHPLIKGRKVQVPLEIWKEHASLTGKTGSGKSSLTVMQMQAMIDAWIKGHEKAPGFTLFDPAKDTAVTVLNRLLKAEADGAKIEWEKVHYISFKDTDYPVALNLFHKNPGEDTNTVVENIMALFKTAFPEAFKVEKYLQNTIHVLIEDTKKHNILGVTKMFTDEEFRSEVVHRIQDPVLKEFWESQTDTMLKSVEDSIYNRINGFQSSLFMRRMFGQDNWTFNLMEWMEEGHIVLIDMLGLSELNQTMTVGHLITQYHQICNKRAAGKAKLHMLFVDECHLVQVPVMQTIIAFDRKFGLGLNLISQSMKQYQPWLKDSIKEILSTLITGVVGDETAREFETMTNGKFKAELIKDLQPNNAAVYTKYNKKIVTCLVETEPPYIYLPTGEAAKYGTDEMDQAKEWTMRKARELQKREGVHYELIDEKVMDYLRSSKKAKTVNLDPFAELEKETSAPAASSSDIMDNVETQIDTQTAADETENTKEEESYFI